MNNPLDLVERLVLLRGRLRLDQQEMGKLLGVTREWVSKIENRKAPVSTQVERLLNMLENAPREDSSHLMVEESSPNFGERSGSASPLHKGSTRSASPTPISRPPDRVISPSDSHVPNIPDNPPTAQDVRSYVELLLAAAAADPKRVGRLVDTLHEQWESTRQYWLKNPRA